MTQLENRSRWRQPKWFVPLVIIAFVALGFTAFRIASGSGVKRDVEAIRKRGLPTSSLELDTWYKRVPAQENAALVYLEASRLYVTPSPKQDPDGNSVGKMRPGQPLPPTLNDAITVHVQKNGPVIEKIHAGADLKASRYPIDLTQGPDTLLPHLSGIRELALLMRWNAVQQSLEGEQAEAVRSVRSGFALAASLEQEPLLISSLVRIASVAIMLPAMERVVSDHVLTEEQLSSLNEILLRAEENGKKALARSIVGERAGAIPLFHLDYARFARLLGMVAPIAGANPVPDMATSAAYYLRRLVGMPDRDLAFYLQKIGMIESALEKDFPEMVREAQIAEDGLPNELKAHRVRYLISAVVLPTLAKALNKEAMLAGQIRCARLALAIERYRLRHGGKFPSPNDLVPEFLDKWPGDPVDDEPLRFEKDEVKGYKILSVGASALKRKGTTTTNILEVAFRISR